MVAASTPRLAATGQIKAAVDPLTEEDGRRQEEHHGQEIRILLEECYSRFLDLREMRIDDGGGKPHNAEYDYQAFGSAFKRWGRL